MDQNNELAPQAKTIPEVLDINHLTFSAMPKVAQGWLTMAALRITTFQQLERDELQVQSLLNNLPTAFDENTPLEQLKANLTTVQQSLANAKSAYQQLYGRRLSFTNMLDEKIIQPAMQYERRVQVLIASAETSELELRKQASKKNNEQSAKSNELARLKAHIESEYYRLAAQYRTDLNNTIVDAYTKALSNKMPVDQLPDYLARITDVLQKINVVDFHVFNRILVTSDEAEKLFSTIKPYEPQGDFSAALLKLQETFSMYEHDLANAEKAIAAVTNKAVAENLESQQQLQRETFVNNLQAESGSIESTGFKGVVQKFQIVTENTDMWAQWVMTAYLKNPRVKIFLTRVKKWENLSVAQMGEALAKLAGERATRVPNPTEHGAIFQGLQFNVIEK
jgi:hypothetical protein